MVSYSTVTGTVTGSATLFSSASSCETALRPTFYAAGVTHVEYVASSPMTLYALDASTMINGGIYLFLAFDMYQTPGGGNWVGYKLGSAYPLTGSVDLNLPQGTYAVVLVATTSPINPTATVVVSPVEYLQTTTLTNSIPQLFTTTGNTTVTFSTVLEVPSIQTYGYSIAAIIVVIILSVAVWIAVRRKTKQPTKRRRRSG